MGFYDRKIIMNRIAKMIVDGMGESEKSRCYLCKKLESITCYIEKLVLFVIVVSLFKTGDVFAQEVLSEVCVDSESDLYDKIYVISLNRTPERYEYVGKQLDKFHLKYERFSGVDGKLLTIKDEEKNFIVPNQKIGLPVGYFGNALKISYQGLYKDADVLFLWGIFSGI